MSDSSLKPIASLEKALYLLEVVSQAPRELSIADLVKATGYGRSSVQRLVHTLCSCGALSRNPGSTDVSLGSFITHYAYAYLAAHPLIEVAVPYLVDLSSQLDLGCDLWLVDGDEVVTAIRIPTLKGSEAISASGKRLPALRTAAGRSVYASLSPDQQEHWYSQLQADLGKGEVIERPDTASTLKNGYYFSNGDIRPGVVFWSAPVYDYSDNAFAAISVSGHISDTDEQTVAEVGKRLAQYAQTLTEMRIQPSPDRRNQVLEKVEQVDDEGGDEDPLMIKAILRGLKLLSCLQPSTPTLTLTEFHRMTGFSVPMAQRLTNTFIRSGYLEKNDNQKTFRLTAKTLDFIYGFQSKFQLLKVVWPRLLQLRRQFGLRGSFCMLEGDNITHILHIQSAYHVEFQSAIAGRSLPAVSTAGGRILLAQLTDEELDKTLEAVRIEALTPFTVTDKAELKTILLEARENGYAFTDQQSIMGEVNVAVPVVHNGNTLGAVVISAPKQDWDCDRLLQEVVPALRQITHLQR